MGTNKTYSDEFKRQAVELALHLKNTAKAAKQLGIRDVNIHKWKTQFKLTSSGSVSDAEHAEIKRLKKENEELKKNNYILSRAAAFFSQDHLK